MCDYYNSTFIVEKAFNDLKYLESITFNSKLKVISVNSFSGCSSLKKIGFPNTLEENKSLAFSR